MKYVNYLIAFALITFASIWIFNHVHAWAGIGLFLAAIYFVIAKSVSFFKEKFK